MADTPEHPRYDPDRYRQLSDEAAEADDPAVRLRELQLRELLAWASPDPALVSLLPKGKGRGNDSQTCDTCGGWHKPGMFHLDYVGHADATKVLASIDPWWSWEPTGTDEHGRPVFDLDDRGRPMGLWIRLTVAGVTRLGYGTADSGKAEVEKELIGDAIRNAAMRFGVAVDLWSKADKADTSQGGRTDAPSRPQASQPQATETRTVGRGQTQDQLREGLQQRAAQVFDWNKAVAELPQAEQEARKAMAVKWRDAREAAPDQVEQAAPLIVEGSLGETFATGDLDELQQLVELATEAAATAVAGDTDTTQEGTE